MGTKGTWRRDAAVSEAEVARRWELAFGPHRRKTELERAADAAQAEAARRGEPVYFEWQHGIDTEAHPPQIGEVKGE